MSDEFKPMTKISRWSRDIVITEKIDGTNASILIGEDGSFKTGSRTRWITPEDDNYGFSKWAYDNKDELMKLGPGHHFGEWAGSKIQRGYGLKERQFFLFNVSRWNKDNVPSCCKVVPIIYEGPMDSAAVRMAMRVLEEEGSLAVPGFKKPEGIIIFHAHGNILFKKTFEKDEQGKGQ